MNLYKIGKQLFDRVPILRPILYKGQMYFRPKFAGAGMTTVHNPPNMSESDQTFNDAFNSISRLFPKNANPYSLDDAAIQGSLWKFWYVFYAASFADRFAKSESKNLVECGVGNGYSAFFALSASKGTFHLYDSWGMIRDDLTLDSEQTLRGHYGTLDINQTKKSLAAFPNITWHQGYIPETFSDAPESIIFLHIDLNSAVPTQAALEFFYPRLEENGVILFDDYGLEDYPEARKIIDDFLHDRRGIMLKLPTAQAIWINGSAKPTEAE